MASFTAAAIKSSATFSSFDMMCSSSPDICSCTEFLIGTATGSSMPPFAAAVVDADADDDDDGCEIDDNVA